MTNQFTQTASGLFIPQIKAVGAAIQGKAGRGRCFDSHLASSVLESLRVLSMECVMRKTFAIPSKQLRLGWSWGPDRARVIDSRLLDEQTFLDSHAIRGSVYFIHDVFNDTLKIGHSGDPGKRLRQLQTGNPSPLKLIGIVAARREIEQAIHDLFGGSSLEGEWFTDAEGSIRRWLKEVTFNQPWQRCEWLTAGMRDVTWQWNTATCIHDPIGMEPK